MKAAAGLVRWLRAGAIRIGVFVAIAGSVWAGGALLRKPQVVDPSIGQLNLTSAPAESLAQSRDRVAFFERRLSRNPGDIDVLNRLSALYLQRLRETGAFSDLDLAKTASQRSLAIVPAIRNVEGLASRAMTEFSAHDFAAARDDALALVRLDSSGRPYALLGDAYAELGDYHAAERAYAQLRRGVGEFDENVASRRSRMALLMGENETAKRELSTALRVELGRSSPSRERVAWYSWQMGDTSFFTGDYPAARASYEQALAAYPGYFRALASIGRLDAAQGDYPRAEARYKAAIETLPDPTFVAELGDVYALSGDRKAAAREYALVDFIGHLSAINGVMYNRQLVMFYADHNRRAPEAYRLAKGEYVVRRDILGADAVAWSALKAGKLAEARTAIRVALRLGTKDPRLLYHAGMIARASRDTASARRFLESALRLSPEFDPFQARVARTVLATLRTGVVGSESAGTDRS